MIIDSPDHPLFSRTPAPPGRLISSLLNVFFKLLYSHLAWLYDLVAWIVSAGSWWEWQKSALPEQVHGSILDLGTGTGHLLRDLLLQDFNITGMDKSRQMVSITRKKLLKNGLPSALVRADVHRIPFPACSFDLLIATFPPRSLLQPKSASEYFRLLKPGGQLRITLAVAALLPDKHNVLLITLHFFLKILYGIIANKQQASLTHSFFEEVFAGVGFTTKLCRIERNNAELLVLCCSKPETEAARGINKYRMVE